MIETTQQINSPQKPSRPWDRWPQESDQAWQAFREYRDFGPDRTAQRVAERIGKSTFHLQTYSSRYDWVRRVRAWEAHVDDLRQKEFEAVTRKMAQQHAEAAQYLWQRAIKVIDSVPDDQITVREAVSMFRAALPMERLARAADHPPPKRSHYDAIGQDFDDALDKAAGLGDEVRSLSIAADDVPEEPPPGPDDD